MIFKFNHSLTLTLAASLLLTVNPAFAGMRESVADQITNMAIDLSCDNNEQCKAIGFGDKPCGGFVTYKVYSTKTVNDTTFTELVKSYNALDKQENAKNQMASTCDMVLAPTVSCIAKECKVVGSTSQAPSAY